MNDVGVVHLVVSTLVFNPHALGDAKVKLAGTRGFFTTSHGAELDVNFWAVECSFAFAFVPFEASFFDGLANHAFGELPRCRIVDEFFLSLRVAWIPGREPQVEFFNSQNFINLATHLHDRCEFGFNLFRSAINVRVIHAHSAHAKQARQSARIFKSVDIPVFGQAHRQITVTAEACAKNFVVMRAIHGAQTVGFTYFLHCTVRCFMFLFQLHRWVHVRGVIG